jgi:poly(3-hydroxybutyrate) depolymerase
MKLFVQIVAALLITIVSATAQERYYDNVFDDAVVTSDLVYGSATDVRGALTELLFDLYTPKDDTATQRPLAIIVHGGGFTSGTKDGEYFQKWGRDFARRGFVAVSISYRLGVIGKVDASSMYEASYRAQQDVRAAVRFLRAHASEYGVDAGRIYLVGASAGGIASLHASVLDQDEVPAYVDAALGEVEGNSGSTGVSSRVQGLVSCWGAVTDTLNIDGDAPPIAAIHGTNDVTVPYQCGETPYGLTLCGGEAISTRAANIGITHELQLFQGAGHTLSGNPVLLDSCFDFLADFLAGLATSSVSSVHEGSPQQPVVWTTVYDLHGRHVAAITSEEPSVDPPSSALLGLTSGVYIILGQAEGRVRTVIRVTL